MRTSSASSVRSRFLPLALLAGSVAGPLLACTDAPTATPPTSPRTARAAAPTPLAHRPGR
jgi:hypothetical protein